jgi:fructosamine-3-kinase
VSLSDDVSWPVLSRIVNQWLGESVELTGVKSLHGGSMSMTLLLQFRRHKAVVLKIAPHMVVQQYQHEAYQLNMLRDRGLPCPEVYASKLGDLDDPNSYLLMEHMPGELLSVVKSKLNEDDLDHIQKHLAELVLQLHGQSGRLYHKVGDGTEQGTRDFAGFFHDIYDPILDDVLAMELISPPLRRRIRSIHGKLDRLLQHSDKPRLVHGDLWSSNLLVQPDRHGKWWVSGLLDPNCRYSHAEMELAYLELFRTVTPTFFRVYEQVHRLSDEYRRVRRDLYMLYPLLNHIRLFGKQYVKPLGAVAERIAVREKLSGKGSGERRSDGATRRRRGKSE